MKLPKIRLSDKQRFILEQVVYPFILMIVLLLTVPIAVAAFSTPRP